MRDIKIHKIENYILNKKLLFQLTKNLKFFFNLYRQYANMPNFAPAILLIVNQEWSTTANVRYKQRPADRKSISGR